MTTKKPSFFSRLMTKIQKNWRGILGFFILLGGIACFLSAFGVIQSLISMILYVAIIIVGCVLCYVGLRLLGYVNVTNAIDRHIASIKKHLLGP